MAIDLSELRNNLYVINQISQRMLSLTDAALTAKFVIDTVEIPFTAEKRQEIVDRYIVLQNNLKIKVNLLP